VRSLPNVLWLGGPPRSGKTTIARRIARRHGLRWYNADAHTWEHRDRALAAGSEPALRWEAMTPAGPVLAAAHD
jgi:replication-associated recombination protein RarA